MAGTVETDTPIIPDVIAESIGRELNGWFSYSLSIDLLEGLQIYLTDKAAGCYQNGETWFARKVKSNRGNYGRDYLYSFMRHWTAGYLKDKYPVLFDQLPREYANGIELPQHGRSELT